MNKDVMKGSWNELKGKIKSKWGKLTDDELQNIDGDKDQLLGSLQRKYGLKREEAEQQIHDFLSSEGKDEVPAKEYRH